MRLSNKLMAGAALLIPLAVAGCDNRSDQVIVAPPPGPPPPKASFQSMFGTSFATFFDASATSDPKDPTAADVPPLSLTAEPLDS